MNESNRAGLIIAFVVVVILFLVFGGGMMTGWNGSGMMGSGRIMGDGTTGPGGFGGYSWMWIPTVITLGVGLLLGWAIFGKKR